MLAAADALSSFGSAAFGTSVPTLTAAAGQTPVDKDKRSDSTLATKVRQFWTCLNVRMYACMYVYIVVLLFYSTKVFYCVIHVRVI